MLADTSNFTYKFFAGTRSRESSMSLLGVVIGHTICSIVFQLAEELHLSTVSVSDDLETQTTYCFLSMHDCEHADQ
jgi:hypothetical protein